VLAIDLIDLIQFSALIMEMAVKALRKRMFWFLTVLLVFLIHDATSIETSNLQENPLVIRFSFGIYNNNVGKKLEMLLRKEKNAINELEQREKDRLERVQIEREAKIYRDYLAHRVQGSFVKDFFTLRF
jgi:hypothetical protein